MPTDVQAQLEQRRTDRFINGASLLADNNSLKILPFQSGESVDLSVGQSNSDSPMIVNLTNPDISISKVGVSVAGIIPNFDLFKIGSSEGSLLKGSSTQIGSLERGIIQVTPIEVNSIQTTVVKDSLTQVGILESSPIQISTLDTDGNSLGWFIDTTPDDNTEFDQNLTTTA